MKLRAPRVVVRVAASPDERTARGAAGLGRAREVILDLIERDVLVMGPGDKTARSMLI
jgi:hypothetical protein